MPMRVSQLSVIPQALWIITRNLWIIVLPYYNIHTKKGLTMNTQSKWHMTIHTFYRNYKPTYFVVDDFGNLIQSDVHTIIASLQ